MAAKVPKGSAIFALPPRRRLLYVGSSIGGTFGLVVGIIGERLQHVSAHHQTSISGTGWALIVAGLAVALGGLANCTRLVRQGRRLAQEAGATTEATTATER